MYRLHGSAAWVITYLTLISALVIPTGAYAADVRRGPYMGETPPGMTAVMFAPDVISVTGRYEFGVSFSPAGDRLLFTVQTPEQDVKIVHTSMVDGVWSDPVPLQLALGQKKAEMEAFFAPDGRHVFFAPYDEGMDVRLWQVEVDGDQWRDPIPLTGDIAQDPAFYPTCAADGTLYYTNIAKRGVYRAHQNADGSWTGKSLGLDFGAHGFVAPDQSFVLLDARREEGYGKRDLYVAFADGEGTWSTPVNLGVGVNSAYSETCPSLSADGKYVFFSRYNEDGDVAQIYWVDAGVIEAARRALVDDDQAIIAKIVHDSIARAVTKNRPRLESLIAHDDDYFCYHPEGLVPVVGYEASQGGFDFWMDERFVVMPPVIRDFRSHRSRSGDVAWFSTPTH